MDANLSVIDIVIIIVQFFAVFAFGIWISHKSNRTTLRGYFLADKQMSWWLVGLSLFVSNIGNAAFVGLAGAASSRGYPVAAYEFSAVFCLLLLANVFMPVYITSGVYTMPEYIKLRFGGSRLYIFLAVTLLFTGITTNLAGEMYAGIILIQQTLGWPLYVSISAILFMTAIYTVSGGLTAVVYTDAMQSILIIVGSIILAVIAIVDIGGFGNIYPQYMEAIPRDAYVVGNTSCGVPSEADWHIFQPASDQQYPWPGVSFGIIILSSYFWCTNQIIVQRSLASKNLDHAKGASVLAGYLKILPMLVMIVPGMISRALFTDEVACQTAESCIAACGNPKGCADAAYPKLLLALMPTGIKGLMLAAMLAALMSTLTSIFNSLSSIFTMDLWMKLRKEPSQYELLIVGRVTTGVIAVISILWIPIIQAYGAGELFVYLQSMASYLYPPVFAIFTAGVLWTRATEKGAFAGLITGISLGALRFICDFYFKSPGCGEIDTRPGIIRALPFLNFAIVLYAVSVLVIIAVSLLTKPSPVEKLVGMTYWTRHQLRPKSNDAVNETSHEKDRTTSNHAAELTLEEHRENDSPETSSNVFLKFICCFGDTPQPTNEERRDVEESQPEEISTKWRKIRRWFVNVNMAVCFGVGVLVYIVFG